MKAYILIVESNFEILKDTDIFGIVIETCGVHDIKKKAKKEFPLLAQVSNARLALWRTGKRTLDETLEVLKNDRDAMTRLQEYEQVADLGLSDGEIVVIQLLGTSRISTAPEAFSDNLVDQSIHNHPVTTIDDDESEDQVGNLKEYARMFKLLYLIEYR